MEGKIQNILKKLIENPGQGSAWEQIEKLVRREQRKILLEKLEENKNNFADFPIELCHVAAQNGKKMPMKIRLKLPTWKSQDEIFWQALGDYAILALWSVKDFDYNSQGSVWLDYFNTIKKGEKNPQQIKEIIQGLAWLVENEELPTDFTRFRRMAEKRHTIAGMSLEEAAFYAGGLKLLSSLLRIKI